MTFNRRLQNLTEKIQPGLPVKYLVCYCDRDDGQHNENCPALDQGDNDILFKVITVRYDRPDQTTGLTLEQALEKNGWDYEDYQQTIERYRKTD